MLESNNETPLSCPMCDSGVSPNDEFCPSCSMPLEQMRQAEEEPVIDLKADVKELAEKKQAPRKKRNISTIELTLESLKTAIKEAQAQGIKVALGLDPGARYTGICVVDQNDKIYFITTLYRDDDADQIEWAYHNVDWVKKVADEILFDFVAIENTVDPTGFENGEKAPLNPKHIIRTALVVGALSVTFREKCVMIRPRKNGSKGPYQSMLNGTRSKEFSWHIDKRVKVRDHEKSAYDVAMAGFFESRKDS